MKQLPCVLMVAFAATTGAAEPEQKLLQLSYEQFDQTRDGGWRTLTQERRCSEAARLIERYATMHAQHLDPFKKFSLAFHAAQMYGMANASSDAIRKLEEARVLLPNSYNDSYVIGLLGYWKKDRVALQRAEESVRKLPDDNPAKAAQLKSVEALIEYQDCSFAVIGKPRPAPNVCPIDPAPCG